MHEFRIYPYKSGSASARILAEALGGRRIRLEGTSFRPNSDRHIVINWGNPRVPEDWNITSALMLNYPYEVGRAANKLQAFRRMRANDVRTPYHTTNLSEAQQWFRDGTIVLGRDLINGSGGRGITVYHPDECNVNDIGEHRFYVPYIKKKREFRIHVGLELNNPDPQVIFIQEKKRRAAENRDNESYNSYIRNYSNEWVFAHNDLDPVPAGVITQAFRAVRALGLQFGAVDVVYNQHYDNAYVLEVNTACGLQGETINRYVSYFEGIRNQLAEQ